MDEFIDHFFSSSSWSDNASATERSSLVSNRPSQTTRILSNSIGPHEGAEKYSHTSLISPSHTTDNLAAIPGTCLLIGDDDSNSGFNRGLHPREARPKQEGSKRAAKPLLGLVDTNLKSGYLGLQLDSSSTSQGTLNYSSPESLPVLGGLAKSTHAPPDCSDEISTNNPSGFQGSLRDAQGLPSIPHSWSSPPSYVSYPSHSAAMGQDKPPAFGLQGEHVDADATVPGNRFLDDDRFLHMDNLTRPVFGQDELHQNCLSSFDAGAHVTLTATAGLPSQLELSQMNEEKHYANPSPIAQPQPELSTAGGGCNGAIKPRVRARRGQATDPHSIAERLRREKIADRMKNLQEVVPNSNKTDKASMLDEIIDYVKFLQLQVKVLSMSRLGGAGAVVPLVTDSRTEGFCGPVVSPSDGQEAIHSEVLPLGPENNVAFEKEVAKLMDSNVTTAMQYLQSKGLCLMPIALASAISGWKPPSFSSTHGFGVHQLSSSSDSSEILGKDSTVAAAAATKQ